jgi:formamidopyrimidine-DNA glycosylase
MPELPEVETIRRQLEPHLADRLIADAEVLDSLWCAPRPPAEVENALRGRRIETLDRRGKYLIMELDRERFLVMHLRMTGNLLWFGPAEGYSEPRYLRFRMTLEDGGRILFADLRRFGTGIVVEGRDSLHDYLGSRLGPEPLDPSFTLDRLKEQARGRKAPVKAFLLDQRRVAGIGNNYADERVFIRSSRPVGLVATSWGASAIRSCPCCRKESGPSARRSTATVTPTAKRDRCRTDFRFICARAIRVRAVAPPSESCAPRAVEPTSAPAASVLRGPLV